MKGTVRYPAASDDTVKRALCLSMLLCAGASFAAEAPDDQADAGVSRSYLVLDGVALESVILAARRMNPDSHTLYEHLVESEFVELSPHLFTYHSQSRFAQLWLAAGRTHGYGFRVISKASPAQLVAHLQRFLLADITDANGTTQLYFRFFDPRVLNTLLPTLHPEQLRDFFGPIDAFVVESDDNPDADVVYVLGADGALNAQPAQSPKSTLSADDAATEIQRLQESGDVEQVRKHLELFGQLQSFSQAHQNAMPFTNVCPCNAFKLTRSSGIALDATQYQAFSAHALRWYKQRLFDWLVQGAGRRMPAAKLRQRIEAGYQQAMRYGITTQGPVGDYVELCVRLGLSFHLKPTVQKVLTDSSLDGQAKVNRLKADLQ